MEELYTPQHPLFETLLWGLSLSCTINQTFASVPLISVASLKASHRSASEPPKNARSRQAPAAFGFRVLPVVGHPRDVCFNKALFEGHKFQISKIVLIFFTDSQKNPKFKTMEVKSCQFYDECLRIRLFEQSLTCFRWTSYWGELLGRSLDDIGMWGFPEIRTTTRETKSKDEAIMQPKIGLKPKAATGT